MSTKNNSPDINDPMSLLSNDILAINECKKKYPNDKKKMRECVSGKITIPDNDNKSKSEYVKYDKSFFSGNNINTGSFTHNLNEKVEQYNKYQLDYLKGKLYLDDLNKKTEPDNNFFNLTINDVYNNIMNLLPNLYNDYHKKYLDISSTMISQNKYTPKNIIVRETILSMIFNNKNMIYLGIVIIIIVFLMYLINL